MATVQTVLGPIDSAALGFTLMHEHVVVGMPGWNLDATQTTDRRQVIELASESLSELRALGVQSFVDPCPMELGRDVGILAEVAQRSGLNIICSTGLYNERSGIPVYMRSRSAEYLTDIYLKEIEEGIDGTGIRPGIIKCATGMGAIGEHEEKTLRAAARASRAAGLPITTHTDEGTLGDRQCDIFESEGVDLRGVVIGHSCGTANLAYHVRLLDRGANLGFDRFGMDFIFPDKLRLASLIGLVGVGYAEQLVLSQDFVSCMLGYSAGRSRAGTDRWGGRFFLVKEILPRLRAAGLSEEAIRTLTVDAPRRVFEAAAAGPRVPVREAAEAARA
jgi:phosphotriesterase-related protein